MAEYRPGEIIIGCKVSVSGESVSEWLKWLGLTYTGNFCVMGDFYSVKVRPGQERWWIEEVFSKLPIIVSIKLVPIYTRAPFFATK